MLKRKSRFASVDTDHAAEGGSEGQGQGQGEGVDEGQGASKKVAVEDHDAKPTPISGIDVQAAALRAAEISKQLSSKIAKVSSLLSDVKQNPVIPEKTKDQMLAERAASMKPVNVKAAYRTLRLDDQGREIDEDGKVVVVDVKKTNSLLVNVAADRANMKKDNPYLAHKKASENDGDEGQYGEDLIVDRRLKKGRNRDVVGKKALHFVSEGKYIEIAEKISVKEERKLIAGYASGRKALERKEDASKTETSEDANADEGAEAPQSSTGHSKFVLVPPLADDEPELGIEWWDEAFLPKQVREGLKKSRGGIAGHIPPELKGEATFSSLKLEFNKFFKYVSHPPPVKPLGYVANEQEKPLPMYLTKKERKKIRKATRSEAEQEKRDKQMMGLIPAPEPKLKLSNFMKVLGDQAVADPSKIEGKVMEQMQKRLLSHEMRNLANKLTPAERKEKKLRKFLEDTSKCVSVALFSVRDFSNLKHRFKVDVNANQFYLSGLALICADEKKNMIVVEGGPKGIRKFTRLMTARIDWADMSNVGSSRGGGKGKEKEEDNLDEDDEDNDDDDDDDEEEDDDDKADAGSGGRGSGSSDNRCDLLWQGIMPKRLFAGFKFQEAKNTAVAKKMLEPKGVAHYWDMVSRADDFQEASNCS